jgi:hypothetical protein
MAARPGRVMADLDVSAPYPRDELFRTSADYAHLCRAGLRQASRRRSAHELSVLRGSPWNRMTAPMPKPVRSALAEPTIARPAGQLLAAHPRRRPSSASVLGLWEFAVRWNEVPSYILPGPLLVDPDPDRRLGRRSRPRSGSRSAHHLHRRWRLAVIVGVALAVLFAQSKWLEMALLPYAVVLQVTPIVAIAPLIIIYAPATQPVAADLRLDRRLLPDPVEHHARAELAPTTT